MPIKRLTARLRAQWFSCAMVGLFLLAWAWPSLARFLNPRGLANWAAIVALFFLSGLSLPAREAARGILSWRLHLCVQGFSFVVLPLTCWAVLSPWRDTMPEGLLVGFYVLAVLPTTIASCVAFTKMAGGNFAGALFNAVLGNMSGVFISPLLLMLMLGSSALEIDIDAMRVFLKLGALVLAPLVAGQILRRLALARVLAYRETGMALSRWCVLAIVYFAFGKVFSGQASAGEVSGVFWPLAMLVPAHLAILWMAHLTARLAGLNEKDWVAMLFCGSQKTLAMGLPMAAAVLTEHPDLVGLAALPVIVYHPAQLLAAGFLEEKLRKSRARSRSPL